MPNSRFKTKFLISLQSSGRRWVCNVIGHYDAFLRGEDPTGQWMFGRANPLVFYGTNERWNIRPTHCAKVGGDIILPKMFRFRPAVILIRNPAQVAFSLFRVFKKKNPDLVDYSVEEYLDDVFADFFVDYANKIYRYMGQKNRVFVSYSDLFAEQYVDDQTNWANIIKFIFGDVERDLLKKAIDNNFAEKMKLKDTKEFFKTPPEKMGKSYDEELVISEYLKPKLLAELDPSVLEYFKKNEFI